MMDKEKFVRKLAKVEDILMTIQKSGEQAKAWAAVGKQGGV